MGRSDSRWASFALAAALALAAPGAGDEARAPAARPAVVVELFTSQGCSSCPAADRVLSKLGRDARTAEVTLVPLAFHVDYWNRIGWVDPFSAPRWSARQRHYAAVLGLRSVYTPQVVLNGRAELVGSHEGRLRAELPGAVPARPAGRVEIASATVDTAARELVVDVVAERLEGRGAPRLVANLVLFESGLVTRVASGENARRTLENDHVVRLLRPAISLDPGELEQAVQRERLRIGLDASWRIANLGLAAFLQDPESLEIHAAAVLPSLTEVGRPPT